MKKIIISVLTLSTLAFGSAVIGKQLNESNLNIVYEPIKDECVKFDTLLNKDQFLKRNAYRSFKKHKTFTALTQYNFAAFDTSKKCERMQPRLKKLLKNNEKFTNFIKHEKFLENNLKVSSQK